MLESLENLGIVKLHLGFILEVKYAQLQPVPS